MPTTPSHGDDLKKNPSIDPSELVDQEIAKLVSIKSNRVVQQCLQAIRRSQQSGDKRKLGWAVFELALELRSQGQYANSVQILEKTRSIFEDVEDEAGLASTFEELAYSSRELSRNALALEYSHNAIHFLKKLNRIPELGIAYDNLAYIYFFLYRRHESLTVAKKARAIFREHDMKKELAWNSCNLGMIYLDMEFFDQSEKFYLEAVKLFKELKIEQGLSWSLLGLAIVYRSLCQFDNSLRALSKARTLDKDSLPKDYPGWIMLNEAAIYRNYGEPEKAFQINKGAVNLFSVIKNQVGVAWGLLQLGQIIRERGLTVKSWQAIGRANDFFQDASNKKGTGWAENEWGVTHLELNNLGHARNSFIKASACAEQLDGDALKAEVHKNLADLQIEEGHIKKAAEFIDKADEFRRKLSEWESLPELLMVKARCELLMGRPHQAKVFIHEAEDYMQKFKLFRYKPSLGVYMGEILFDLGDTTGAIQGWTKVLEDSNTYSQPKPRTEALLGLVQAQWKEKSSAEVGSLLSQIEKDLRTGGSRKLRAKYLILKGFLPYLTKGMVENRVFSQAIQILDVTGLVVIKLQALDQLSKIYHFLKKEKERERCNKEIQILIQQHSIDIGLLRFGSMSSERLPVSLTL